MEKIIPLSIPCMDGNEKEYLNECIDSGWVSTAGGRFLQDFERAFCEYTGCVYSNAVINGTAALHLALAALGVGKGDEVIIPSLTFISTANAVKYVGADIVFVDVDRDNYCMDIDEVRKAVSPKTKAVIPVHLYGNMADMESLMELAKEKGFYVIEDATEGLGSFQKGRMAGSIGHIGCYSFNGNKLITTGAGGMICCNDLEMNNRIDYLKNQSKTILENKGVIHQEMGYNYRMPNLLAAVGLAQLEGIVEKVEKKKAIRSAYKEKLDGKYGIRFNKMSSDEDICPWLTCAEITQGEEARNNFIQEMGEQGVICRPFFYPLHLMEPFKNEKSHGTLKNTCEVSECGVNLPSSVQMSEKDIERVIGYVINK